MFWISLITILALFQHGGIKEKYLYGGIKERYKTEILYLHDFRYLKSSLAWNNQIRGQCVHFLSHYFYILSNLNPNLNQTMRLITIWTSLHFKVNAVLSFSKSIPHEKRFSNTFEPGNFFCQPMITMLLEEP